MSDLQDLELLDLKIKKLEQQKLALEHSLNQNKERKERTRLLIQTGGLCEKYMPEIKDLDFHERELYFKTHFSETK